MEASDINPGHIAIGGSDLKIKAAAAGVAINPALEAVPFLVELLPFRVVDGKSMQLMVDFKGPLSKSVGGGVGPSREEEPAIVFGVLPEEGGRHGGFEP